MIKKKLSMKIKILKMMMKILMIMMMIMMMKMMLLKNTEDIENIAEDIIEE
jgi:hypothetical protein